LARKTDEPFYDHLRMIPISPIGPIGLMGPTNPSGAAEDTRVRKAGGWLMLSPGLGISDSGGVTRSLRKDLSACQL